MNPPPRAGKMNALGSSAEGPRTSFSVCCSSRHCCRQARSSSASARAIEARDEKKLLRFQKLIASYELLIVDELGFVPLSKTGAELLFEMLSQRYERGS